MKAEEIRAELERRCNSIVEGMDKMEPLTMVRGIWEIAAQLAELNAQLASGKSEFNVNAKEQR